MFFIHFESAVVLELSGVDAGRYLNGRLTADISALGPRQGRLAAALTPLGKTEFFGWVWRHSDASWLVVCEQGESDRIIEGILRYKVADRLECIDRSNQWSLVHVPESFIAPEMAANKLMDAENDLLNRRECSIAAFAIQRSEQKGWDFITPKPPASFARQVILEGGEVEALDNERARLLRLKAWIPTFPEEVNSDYLFLESGIEQAISHSRGCYVGHEVIERTQSRGKPPARLLHFIASGCCQLKAGSTLFREAGKEELGTLISSAVDSEERETYGFARIRTRYVEELLRQEYWQLVCGDSGGVIEFSFRQV